MGETINEEASEKKLNTKHQGYSIQNIHTSWKKI